MRDTSECVSDFFHRVGDCWHVVVDGREYIFDALLNVDGQYYVTLRVARLRDGEGIDTRYLFLFSECGGAYRCSDVPPDKEKPVSQAFNHHYRQGFPGLAFPR